MVLREQDKHFLWSLLIAIGIIFVWKGLWEGLYEIPYIGNEWVALFLGLAILTFSGIIFKEFDPLGNINKSAKKIVSKIYSHPEKGRYKLKYHDQHAKKDFLVNVEDIVHVSNDTINIKLGGKEFFIPSYQIKEVTKDNKKYRQF